MFLCVAPYTLSLKVPSEAALHEDCPCFPSLLLYRFLFLSSPLWLHSACVISSLLTRHFWYICSFRGPHSSNLLLVDSDSNSGPGPRTLVRLTQSSERTSHCLQSNKNPLWQELSFQRDECRLAFQKNTSLKLMNYMKKKDNYLSIRAETTCGLIN